MIIQRQRNLLNTFSKVAFKAGLVSLWSLILAFASQDCRSQEITFDHLTIDHGLSNNTVYAITEDADGFLWFGTRDGLNRYDGYEFKVYKKDLYGLNSNNVQALFSHPNGDLWVGFQTGGLAIFRRSTQTFDINPFRAQIFPDWSTVSVHAIFLDSRGYMWLGTSEQGVVRIDPGLEQLEHFSREAQGLNRRLKSSSCFSFVEDDQKNVWMGTSEERIHCYRPDRDSVVVVESRPEKGINLYSYRKSLLFYQGILWIGTQGNGLFQYDPANHTFVRHLLRGALIEDVELYEDKVLISTDGEGLYYTSDFGQSFTSVSFMHGLSNSLNTNALYDVFVDGRKNIWIGSFNGGLNYFKVNKTPFFSYSQRDGVIAAPGIQSVLAFYEDNQGFIWMGKDGGGLVRLDPLTREQKNFYVNRKDPASLSSNVITSLYEDCRGYLWAGTFANGLNLFDKTTEKARTWRSDPDDPHSISNDNVWAIEEDDQGNLWIATLGGGLNYFDYSDGKFYSYQPDPVQPRRKDWITDRNIRDLLVDTLGNVWVATEYGGLNYLEVESQRFQSWKAKKGDPTSLNSNSILCLYLDSKNTLWLGTEGGGLNKMVNGKRGFIHYSTKEGFPSDVINAIEEDKQGVLWVSTNQGLVSFDPRKEEVLTFDKNDGLQSNQFNPGASLTTNKGIMYFGGINGINYFFPEEVKSNPNPPKVIFTDFKLFNRSLPVGKYQGREILSGPLNEGCEISLDYSDNVISISFAALDFTNPHKNQYAYRLLGFEEDWNRVDATHRQATYTNLDAGDYRFQVRASNNNGVWNPNPAELIISIRPPFWKTWWFRLVVLGFVAGMVYGYLAFLTNKRKEAYQKEIMKAEQEILKLKNERLSQEVEQKNAQLSAALLQSAHKNNSLDHLRKQLIDIGKESPGDAEQKKEIRGLIRKIEFELSSEDYWEQFQLNFDQVHQQFSKLLYQKHPALSPNDIRLCCLLRINMTNKQIASIQNISIGAVEKSKYRLKKKLKLDKEADLNLYILNFST